ncbi:hypothetical protein Syun_025604 [Stephania yunnanensis]|uniref:Uncharacterized protein n=1 Tax=Stephania yunnanensis TaxID=152371 RepID=A0AAP0F0V6_9MAGN
MRREGERERNGILIRDTAKRRRIRAKNRRVLEEMQTTTYNERINQSSEQPAEDFTGTRAQEMKMTMME